MTAVLEHRTVAAAYNSAAAAAIVPVPPKRITAPRRERPGSFGLALAWVGFCPCGRTIVSAVGACPQGTLCGRCYYGEH